MKKFLTRIKFIRNSKLQLETNKDQFYHSLCQIVDDGEINIFSEQFEMCSSGNNEYIGFVKNGEFKIKRKKRFFDFNIFKPVVTGTFSQKQSFLNINFETNVFRADFALMSLIVIISLFFIIFGVLKEDNYLGKVLIIELLFLGSILFTIGRYKSKSLKKEIEKKFKELSNEIK